MNNILSALSSATAGMNAQSGRLRHVSENIANADTPGYQKKMVSFERSLNGGLELSPVRLDPTAPERIFDPSNPLADASGHYDGSNVNLVIEIADAREAQRSYEANLNMFDQARRMTQSLFELIRQ